MKNKSLAILTTYFSQKPHPNDPKDKDVIGRQDNGFVSNNSFEYIKKWYESIVSNKIEARIFCDNLSEDFINTYTTDKIKFIKVDTSEFSNNDWRFFCYRNYLANNYHDYVILTDISDVVVVKDPINIFTDYPEVKYFICKDSINITEFGYLNIHKMFRWENLPWFTLKTMQKNLDLLNMGVIGSDYHNMMDFLDKFCLIRTKMQNPNFNADMWVGQYVFRYYLKDKEQLIGHPFTSEFKKYQNDRKDVYFIHK